MEDNEIREERRLQAGQQVQPDRAADAGQQVLAGQVAEAGQTYGQEQAAQPLQRARQESYEKKAKSAWLKPLAVALVAVAIAVGSFIAGMEYGESRETTPAVVGAPAAGEGGQTMPTQPGGPMGQGMGVMGEVTAISSSSLSIEDMRSGEVSTYDITASTEILDGDGAAEVGDIEVGDNVMVTASESDEDTAARIMINPTMGGPGGEGFEPPSTSS